LSHFLGRAQVWRNGGKTFFKCAQPQCTLEHEVTAKNLVQDRNSSSGYSVKLQSSDGAWVTIPFASELLTKAPWLLIGIPEALPGEAS